LFVHLLLRVASRRKWKKTSSRPTTEKGFDFSFVDCLQKERKTYFRFTKEIKSTNDDGQLSRCMYCDRLSILFLEQGVIPIFFYYWAGLIIITHSAINAVDAVFKCTQNWHI
jgi:hypothetical protein